MGKMVTLRQRHFKNLLKPYTNEDHSKLRRPIFKAEVNYNHDLNSGKITKATDSGKPTSERFLTTTN